MVSQSATKAKHVATVAVNSRHNLVEVPALDAALYCILAIRGGTPLQILFVVDVCSCEESVISGYISVEFRTYWRV